MPTYQQLVKLNGRKCKPKRKYRLLALAGAPQKKGTCLKLLTLKPKKPNSAIRSIARVILSNKKIIRAYIVGRGTGLGSPLIAYSKVLVRGGRTPDLIGLRFRLVKGVYDFDYRENLPRRKSHTKYGIPVMYWKQAAILVKQEAIIRKKNVKSFWEV